MNLKQKQCLPIVVMIAGIGMVLGGQFAGHGWIEVLGVIMILGGLFLNYRLFRCPHCGRQLGRYSGECCRHCGKKIDYTAKK